MLDIDLAPYINQLIFAACALMGALAHYIKKAAKGETNVLVHEWFGAVNVKSSLATLFVLFFVIIGAIAGDVITAETDFWICFYIGFVTGFAVDAGFNSDFEKPTIPPPTDGKIKVVIRRKPPS